MGLELPIGLVGVLLLAAPSPDLDDGIALYRNKDYRGALGALGRANAQPQSPRRRALIHLYIGIIQFRFGQTDDARNSFEEGLSHRPSAKFPDASQGGARRLFQEVKAALTPDAPPEPKKRRKKKRRRRRRSTSESTLDVVIRDPSSVTTTVAGDPKLPPPYVPPPAPPPLVVTVEPGDGPPPVAWVIGAVGAAAAVTGTVFLVVGIHNGRASRETDRDAVSAERLYGRYQTQVATGLGSLAVAAIFTGVATYLFVAD